MGILAAVAWEMAERLGIPLISTRQVGNRLICEIRLRCGGHQSWIVWHLCTGLRRCRWNVWHIHNGSLVKVGQRSSDFRLHLIDLAIGRMLAAARSTPGRP